MTKQKKDAFQRKTPFLIELKKRWLSFHNFFNCHDSVGGCRFEEVDACRIGRHVDGVFLLARQYFYACAVVEVGLLDVAGNI